MTVDTQLARSASCCTAMREAVLEWFRLIDAARHLCTQALERGAWKGPGRVTRPTMRVLSCSSCSRERKRTETTCNHFEARRSLGRVDLPALSLSLP